MHFMAAATIAEKECPACASRYSVLKRRTRERAGGELDCIVCGETFLSWNSNVRYTECSLVYRGTLHAARQRRFGPSMREVERRFLGANDSEE